MLTEKGLFEQWKQRSKHQSSLELDLNEEGESGDQIEEQEFCTDTVFDDPNGRLDVEAGLDEGEEVAEDVDGPLAGDYDTNDVVMEIADDEDDGADDPDISNLDNDADYEF